MAASGQGKGIKQNWEGAEKSYIFFSEFQESYIFLTTIAEALYL